MSGRRSILQKKKEVYEMKEIKRTYMKAGAFAVAILFLAMTAATTIKADPPLVRIGVGGHW